MSLEGQQLNHYRLIRLLGSGGMGEVYLAEDAQNQQQVAIKVIRSETPYGGNDAIHEEERLFRREAKAIAKLDHPRILSLFDYGEEHLNNLTLFYLVMPYRPEGSFADWLRQRGGTSQLTPQDVVHVVQQAAEALQHAHEQQVIHQDVKPSNFLVQACAEDSMRPDLVLSDFGIARLSTATSSASQSIRGTPTYMAPEQWEGNPVYATDQYGLAVMTYELLTGHPPFQGNAARMMYQHLNTLPPLATSVNPALSPQVDLVLLHALAKQPEQRFSSITVFAEVFAQAVAETLPAEVLVSLLPAEARSDESAIPQASSVSSQPFVEKTGRAYHEIVQLAEPSHTTGELAPQEPLILSLVSNSGEQNGKALLTPPAGSNPSAERTEKVTDPRVFAGVSTPPSHPKAKNRRRPLLLAAVAVVLLSVLVIGGVVFAFPLFNQAASGAVVTLTLKSKLEHNTYTISEVAGTPDTSKQQVEGIRLVSMTTQTYTQTANATGQGTTPGTSATGTLEIDNYTSVPLMFNASTMFQNSFPSPNIAVVLDTSVTVPSGGFADVNVHVVQVGTVGNISRGGFYYCGNCGSGSAGWDASNFTAFAGGTDPQAYTFVQQSDINGAVQSLEQVDAPNPQQVLQSQMQANEQVIGTPQCKPNVKSDHVAGDQATSVTVSVSFTCTGEVYNQQTAQAMASQLLTAQATTDLGSGYALVGNITTTVTNATLTDAKSGMVNMIVNTEGTWAYQLTTAQQQTLLQQMVNKKKADVQALLLKQPGIAAVKITLTGGNGTLFPTDTKNIKIVIQGATASS